MLDLQDDALNRVDSATEALRLIDSGTEEPVQLDRSDVYDVIDFAGVAGAFGVNQPYLNERSVTDNSDFVLSAFSSVTVPPGSWSIAFGSNDGGSLSMAGLSFDSTFNTQGENEQQDVILFDGEREFGWTGGHFQVVGESATTGFLHVVMFEREGEDGFEVAIRDNGDALNSEEPSPDNGWRLLGDGVLDWGLSQFFAPPRIRVAGRQYRKGGIGDQTFSDVRPTALEAKTIVADFGNDNWDFELDSVHRHDRVVVQNPDADRFTTAADVDSATFFLREQRFFTGDSFRLVVADEIRGMPTFDFTDHWDFSEFTETGSITYTGPSPRTCGDFDGDFDVDSADRTIQTVGWTGAGNLSGLIPRRFDQGDCNGDGDVDVADQVGLIQNFTNAMATSFAALPAIVPEPDKLGLLSIAMMCQVLSRWPRLHRQRSR